jgi:hypothetical protein
LPIAHLGGRHLVDGPYAGLSLLQQ